MGIALTSAFILCSYGIVSGRGTIPESALLVTPPFLSSLYSKLKLTLVRIRRLQHLLYPPTPLKPNTHSLHHQLRPRFRRNPHRNPYFPHRPSFPPTHDNEHVQRGPRSLAADSTYDNP